MRRVPPDVWVDWESWTTYLSKAPLAAPRSIVRLTATRWQEESDDLRPVVFGTDHFGNIYYTEQRKCRPDVDLCMSYWTPWSPFYN
jgi:hypothetical protein